MYGSLSFVIRKRCITPVVNFSIIRISASESSRIWLRRYSSEADSNDSVKLPFRQRFKLGLQHEKQRFAPYMNLIRVTKPVGWVLLMLPCWWSVALATPLGTLPDTRLLSLTALGAFCMRSAGCVVNDILDRKLDAKVERTKMRPLASGALSVSDALIFLTLPLSGALACLLQLNGPAILVGCSSLALVAVYPLAKRVTYWPQVVLGTAFGIGVPLGWAAVRGGFDSTLSAVGGVGNSMLASYGLPLDLPVVAPLYLGAIAWVVLYDTIYAHQDKEDDLKAGVKSSALKLGAKTKPALALLAVSSITSVAAAAHAVGASPVPLAIGLSVASTHLAYQIYTVDLDDREHCWRIFSQNMLFGTVVFVTLAASVYYAEPLLPHFEKSHHFADEGILY